MALFSLIVAASAVVFGALAVHLVPILEATGLALATAVFLASLKGVAQVAGRIWDLDAGAHWHPIDVGRVSVAFIPLSFLVLMLGGANFWTALAFTLLFGVANGLVTIMRGAVPLALFGAKGYGEVLGILATPYLLLAALSPAAFALVVERCGYGAGEAILLGAGLLSFLAMEVMALWYRRAAAVGQRASLSLELTPMCADRSRQPIVHLVGSIPLPDAESRVPHAVGARLASISFAFPTARPASARPGSSFLQDVLAEHPAIEVATDVPPFKFVQWDGKLIREIPRLRLKPGAMPDPDAFKTGYADMAIQSWAIFDRLQKAGVDPRQRQVPDQPADADRRRPTTTCCRPTVARLLPALTQHFIGEVAARSPAPCPTTASPCSGTCARRCWPGRATTTRGPSTSAPRPSMCSRPSATRCRRASSSATTCATAARPTSTWCSPRTRA